MTDDDPVTSAELAEVGVLALAAEILDGPATADTVLDAELVDEGQAAEVVPWEGDAPPEPAEVVAEWLARPSFSTNTRDGYARDMRAWLAYLDEELDGDLLTAHGRDVEQWLNHLKTVPLASTGKLARARTIQRRLGTLSSFYTWARRREYVPADRPNPVEWVDRPKAPRHLMTAALTEDESKRLIAAAFGLTARAKGPDTRRVAERDAVVVAVMMTTGLRTSEVRALQVSDLGYNGGYRVARVVRKGDEEGLVVLGPAAELVDRRVKELGMTDGWLFPTRTGAQLPRSWVFESLRKVADAAAIPDHHKITPHSCRHTYATLSLDKGATLDDVRVALGHRDPRTTMGYDHARNRLHRSPTHVVGPALLHDRPDQSERLF